MTSAIQATNLFEHNPFVASNFFRRPTHGKSLEPDTAFSFQALNDGIWQSANRDDLRTKRVQGTQDACGWDAKQVACGRNSSWTQTRRDLSVTVPNDKMSFSSFASPHNRRSPTTTDDSILMQTGPSSAQSINNNDSAVLTPNSLTSSSDHFSQHLDGIYEPRRQLHSSSNAQPHPELPSTWNTVKEFRPSINMTQRRVSNMGNFEPSKKYPSLDSSQLPIQTPTSLKAIWKQNGQMKPSDPLQNWDDFKPVLSVTQPQGSSGKQEQNGQYQRESLVASSKGALVESSNIFRPSNYYQSLQQTFESKPSQPVIQDAPTYKQAPVRDRPRWDQFRPNPWHQDSLIEIQDWQSSAAKFKLYMDQKNMASKNDRENKYYIENYAATNCGSFNTARTDRNADLATQPLNRADAYVCEEQPLYATQTYPNIFYPNTTPYMDYRHGQAFDPMTNMSYMACDNPDLKNDPTRIFRSPLLEEFRVNKAKKYELKDIYDHIVEFSGDQLGSRFIQQKLEVANSEEKDRVFNEIARDSRQLMTDVFGNYVIQKIFEHGNQSQKRLLANHMKGHVFTLSTQTYGCRVVQKALEHILTDQQASLIKELDGNVLKVVENQNGNHVIQKAIERIPGEHIQFIIDAHRGHVHNLSKHPYGCRVIQRMLEHCNPRAKRQVLDELHTNISDLIQDPFGNYVVQHVIADGEMHDRRPVIDKVQAKLLENATHKFASNVVEKAMDYAEEDQCRAMLRKLTGRDEHGQSQVAKLLGHQYGNYVIQKSAAHLTGQALATLVEEMEQYLTQLRRVSNGKQVAALEGSIRDARQRMNNPRHNNSIHNAPTQPRTTFARR